MLAIVELNKQEVEYFKQKPGQEKYVEDCQKVVDALGGKKLILDEHGNVVLAEDSK